LRIKQEGKNEPTFDIPVDEDFFLTILGSHLMKYDGGQLVQLPTLSCLKKSRLVALYFSAHWCGPCRRFTPMLCEMYLHLKATFAVHGLELIFVTSDHDNVSFKKYFSTMPWLAMPFEEASRRRSLSQR
jgi:nucleoredoxin